MVVAYFDSSTRQFPPEWKDEWFRTRGRREGKAWLYACPICFVDFNHIDINLLQGDHVWPYSLFGESSKENYQLICAPCNNKKKNFVSHRLRELLGRGEFRSLVVDFLQSSHLQGEVTEEELMLFLKETGTKDRR